MPQAKPPAAHLLASPDDVEAQFYDALREADLDKLMALWHDDDEVFCVHPGGPRVVGPRAIRAAFEAMFAHGGIRAHPERVHRAGVSGGSVHSVIERIELLTDDGPRRAYVVATNVFVKTAQGWRLLAHHASPGTAVEPPELGSGAALLH